MTLPSASKKNTWKSLFDIVLPYKKKLLMVIFIGLISTGATLLEPLIYREAINDITGVFIGRAVNEAQADSLSTEIEVNPIISFFQERLSDVQKEPHGHSYVASRTPGQAIQTLMWAVILLFIVNMIGRIFQRIGENLNVRISSTIEQNFIYSTFNHVLKLPLDFFTKRSSAALSKQINQSEEVSVVVSGFSQQILPEFISLTGILLIMFTQNIPLTMIALVIIPFYMWIAIRSAKKIEASLPLFYEQWENVSSRIQDALSGIKTVKLSGAELREAERLNKICGDAYQDYIKRIKLTSRNIFWQSTLTRLSSALVLGYGGYLALIRQLTPGDVVMFVAYLDRLYTPIDTLANLWINLQQNAASIQRAFNLRAQGLEEKKGTDFIIRQGKIEFKNVHFGYVSTREVLKGITFSILPGKVTAIVGGSGAGKTTTVDLLLKLYEPSSGEILIDDKPLDHIAASSMRRQVGMVAADGNIFRGSLAENIRYKNPLATEAETIAAATGAGLFHTLERLPEGLLTQIGEGGVGLSVGERQRLQIARILISHPRILVLDEATANLDYATEKEIKLTIKEVSKENTVIIIAHRYSMVRDADHVIVLSDGNVIEEGTPEQLQSNNGWFSHFATTSDEKSESGTG